jgi:hypothetical protein
MFGSKVEKIRSGWIKLHGEELVKSYSSQNLMMMFNKKLNWQGMKHILTLQESLYQQRLN